MISNGNVIEYVPTEGMSNCLEQKRIVSRQIGEDQKGIMIQCKEVKAELYEDCVSLFLFGLLLSVLILFFFALSNLTFLQLERTQ
jgi:hypothetical protein